MKTRPTQIILINDDPAFCKTVKLAAQKHRFKVQAFGNLEDGIEHLETKQKVRAVVLDSQCYIDNDQKPDSLKTNFVFHAMEQINRVEHEQDREIPFCVYANQTFDLSNDLDGIARVFDAKKDEEEMFAYLKEEVAGMHETMIRQEYSDVFDFAEDFLSDEDDDLLETLFMKMGNTDPATIVSNLTTIRRLLEKLFDVLAPNLLGKDAGKFEYRGGGSRTKNIIATLERQRVLPKALKKIANDMYSFSSRFGNHNLLNQRVGYRPGKYVVLALANNMAELLSWSAKTLEEFE